MNKEIEFSSIDIENKDELLSLSKKDFERKGDIGEIGIFEKTIKQELGKEGDGDPLLHINHVNLSPDEEDDSKREIGLYYFYHTGSEIVQKPLGFITGVETWRTIIENYIQKDLQKEETQVLTSIEINNTIDETNSNLLRLNIQILDIGLQQLDRTTGKKDLDNLLEPYTTNNIFDTGKTNQKGVERKITKGLEKNIAIKETRQKILATNKKRELIEKTIEQQQKNGNNSEIQKRMGKIANLKVQEQKALLESGIPDILDNHIRKVSDDMLEPNKTVQKVKESFQEGITDLFTRVQASNNTAESIYNTITSEEAIEKQFMDTGILPDFLTATNLPDAMQINQTFQKILLNRMLINGQVKETEITIIEDADQQSFKQYLDNVINGSINPATTPFVPSSQHENAYKNIMDSHPALKTVLHVTTITQASDGVETVRTGSEVPNFESYQLSGSKESFIDKVNVLEPLIDKLPIADEHKERLKKVSGIASIIGIGFLGFKAIKGVRNLFSSDKAKRNDGMKRLAVAGGVLTASYIATGEGFAFKKTMKKIVDGSVDLWKNVFLGSHNLDVLTKGYEETQEVFGPTMTYGDLNTMIEQDANGKLTINAELYGERIELQPIPKKEEKKKTIETLNKDDRIHNILTSMGITKEVLEDTSNQDEKLNDKLSGSGERIQLLTKYIEDNKLKVDENKKDQVDAFIQEGIANESDNARKLAVEKLQEDGVIIAI